MTSASSSEQAATGLAPAEAPREGNKPVEPTQPYVAAKPSTAATEVDPTPSSYHSKHSSAAELPRNAAKEKGKERTLDGGSEDHVPPAKAINAAKVAKQPSYYQTHLISGINTEKYSYNAEDKNDD